MSNEEDKVLPIIDLSYLTSKYADSEYTRLSLEDFKLKELADKFADALTKWGFVYLINHGIDEKVISNSFDQSKQFFMLENEIKDNFLRKNTGENWGYVPFNVETFDKSRPFDLKECFNFLPTTNQKDNIGKVLPSFVQAGTNFFSSCHSLCMKLLYLINVNLEVKDDNFLTNQHQHIGERDENATISRFLYYPSIGKSNEVKENQLRCGEHSDYGTITLLFQDQVGGLQVVNPSGEYVDATPISGSIVLNCGDMLEIWSSGKFKSTRHRVLVTKEERQCMTLFCHPDNHITVACLDGSDKYSAVNPFEYLMGKFKNTYG